MPDGDGGDDAVVLVAPVDLGADGAAEDVGGEEVEGLGGEGLGGAAEVGALGGVDARYPDGYLGRSAPRARAAERIPSLRSGS